MCKPGEIFKQKKDGIKIVLEQIKLTQQQHSGRCGRKSMNNLCVGGDSGSTGNGTAEVTRFKIAKLTERVAIA